MSQQPPKIPRESTNILRLAEDLALERLVWTAEVELSLSLGGEVPVHVRIAREQAVCLRETRHLRRSVGLVERN